MDCPALPLLVLIVDDNGDSRAMYAHYLRSAGFRVEEASQGFQALDKAFKLLPDVIVMDLWMPALDGWETIRLLKGRRKTHAIPIIALTGDDKIEDLKLAKNAGCDSILLKPCLPDIVLVEIQRLLALAGS